MTSAKLTAAARRKLVDEFAESLGRLMVLADERVLIEARRMIELELAQRAQRRRWRSRGRQMVGEDPRR